MTKQDLYVVIFAVVLIAVALIWADAYRSVTNAADERYREVYNGYSWEK